MFMASEVPTNGNARRIKTGAESLANFGMSVLAEPREESHGVAFLLAKEAKKLPSNTALLPVQVFGGNKLISEVAMSPLGSTLPQLY